MSFDLTRFQPLPEEVALELAWPTPSRRLHDDPRRYFAATRANPDYGRPGWTRDCGRRFHRGCDIAPVEVTRTGRFTAVWFSDLETEEEYESREEILVPHDPVFAVYSGQVQEACSVEENSDFGLHVVLRHTWSGCGTTLCTLYGHLASVEVDEGDRISAGQQIGVMGTTSRIPDARNWMSIAPHLHFEVRDEQKRPYDPAAFLATYLPRGRSKI